MEKAAREGRVALLPEWLQVGREVWYWRECLCGGDDLCADGVTSCCPLNNGIPWYDEVARDCACQHPILEKTTIWSAAACFTPRGVEWIINELPAVSDYRLRSAFFLTKQAALDSRPGKVVGERGG